MSVASVQKDSPVDHFLVPLIATFLIVNFLFFIDEGYYDFRWMHDAGNWFVFGIYCLIIFPIQWMVSWFLFRRIEGWQKTALRLFTGVTGTLGLMYVFVWLIG